ncbi:MAG: GNAT family N-acetyltransferase [Bacteroidota bacterium]
MKSPITRLGTLSDLETLNNISYQSKKHWGYPDEWMERWKDDLTIDENKFDELKILVLELDNKVIGFGSMSENEETYEILDLWLLPSQIDHGFGKLLLGQVISTFAVAQKPITLTADPNAEAFYASQGFVTIDQIESFPKGRFLPVMLRKTSD